MTPQYSVILRAINNNQQKFDLELELMTDRLIVFKTKNER